MAKTITKDPFVPYQPRLRYRSGERDDAGRDQRVQGKPWSGPSAAPGGPSGAPTGTGDALQAQIDNLAREKYDAQMALIASYLKQQRAANQRSFENDRDRAEVNYYTGLRRAREQYGNTNGYNDSGMNQTNALQSGIARANTLNNLRMALQEQNNNAEYNAKVMEANATNNLYDDNWNFIKWMQANGYTFKQ